MVIILNVQWQAQEEKKKHRNQLYCVIVHLHVDVIYSWFYFVFLLCKKKCAWNSRWKWIQEQNPRTRNPSIILLYSAFTLICRIARNATKWNELKRRKKKCLEFASIYTRIVWSCSLVPQSLLNMLMRSTLTSHLIAIHFLLHHRFQSFSLYKIVNIQIE